MPIIENVKEHILNPIIVLAFGVALVFFLYGFVEYLYQGDVGKNRQKAINNIIYGIMGMAIMASVFGIMKVIVDTISSFAS